MIKELTDARDSTYAAYVKIQALLEAQDHFEISQYLRGLTDDRNLLDNILGLRLILDKLESVHGLLCDAIDTETFK